VWANTENPPTDGGCWRWWKKGKNKHQDKSKPVLVKRPRREGVLRAGNQNGPYNNDDDSGSGVSGLVPV